MSNSSFKISFLTRLEHQQLLSSEVIEFGHYLLVKNPNLSDKAFIACFACMKAFEEGRTAIDSTYLQDFLVEVNLNDFSELLLDEYLYEEKIIGKPGDYNLFIYSDGFLYIHTFYEYEVQLSDWILKKAAQSISLNELQMEKLNQFYPEQHEEEIDLQKLAVKLSLLKPLVFLTGGPGTGKTYTVQKIIEIHKSIFGEEYRIRLAAPTGKAAQRINETLGEIDDEKLEAQTIHRLLGARTGFDSFKYNKDRPLAVDLMIVDEASMMDLSLWVALINALPEHAKLIVVGDNNQLASVEAGAVLNDICKPSDNTFSTEIAASLNYKVAFESNNAINDCIITLTKSKRFGEETGIQALAEAIRTEQAELAIQLLEDEERVDIKRVDNSTDNLDSLIHEYAIQPFFEKESNISLNAFSILCALKKGPSGSKSINNKIERALKTGLNHSLSREWYPNRKIIVTKNQHALGVQNGELGIYKADHEQVKFNNNQVPVSRLQSYEPGYCITIHKSQGSEYQQVLIVLPNKKNRVLTKELLYTAVTRAGLSVLIVGDRQLIKETILTPTLRNSGLMNKLWGK
ncbi:MAG: exodeoxyribonuclease V subunit alpha [bacterium]|nr:exodeoxyribonuclease V subunit alpha [bacterium]